MERLKSFFCRGSTLAFLAYTAFYAVLAAFIWWEAWPLDRSMIQPDHNMIFTPDHAARFFRGVLDGGSFIPSDFHWFLGSPYWWAELEYAVPCWLAGLAVFFYLRGRGLGRLAGYGAGLAFALSGYSLTLFSAGHMGWFEFITYGIFVFGLIDRAVRKGSWRNWALLGAMLAWGAARQQDLWMLFTAFSALYGVWCIVRELRTGGLVWKGGVKARGTAARLGVGLALCLLVAAAVGAPMFVNAITQSLSGRVNQINEVSAATGVDMDDPAAAAAAKWEFATNWSMPPEDALEFVAAGVRGDSSDPRVSPSSPYWGRLGRPVDEKFVAGKVMPNYRQHSLYLGAITVVLALFGVFGWFCGGLPKKSDVPFWFGAALVCTLLAMGRYTPFYRLVYSIPMMDYFRAPVKFHHLTELCVAVLAGHGIAVVLGGAEHARARSFAGIASLVLAGFLIVLSVALNADSAAISQGIAQLGIARTPAVCTTLASAMSSSVAVAGVVLAVSAAALWLVPRYFPRMALSVVVLVVAVNSIMLAANDSRYCAAQDISFARGRNDAAAEIAAQGGGKVSVIYFDRYRGAATAYDFEPRPGRKDMDDLWSSMSANGAGEGSRDPNDKTVRFALVQSALEKGAAIDGFLRSRRSKRVGGYVVSRLGVHKSQKQQPDLSLYEFGDWAKEQDKPRKIGVLSIVSLLSTLLMLGWALKYTKSSH